MNQLEQDRLNTLLIDAAESGDADKVIELLDRGANVHAQDDWALFYAAWGDHKEIVELLLDRGADIHAGGDRALLNAIMNGHTETVELLLNRGADVHIQDDLALRWAANYGHPEVVDLLNQHIAQEQAQEQQFIGKTVGEFIKEHPQTTLELMTPGGYVLLNAKIMQRAIERNGKIYPNLGSRGSEYETELNDILSQYINSINPKEDDPNYLYMMTVDHFEDVEFETGEKTMESTNKTAIPITLTANREGEILQDQNQTKGEQAMNVKQENQNKTNEEVKNMEQNSNETKNKSEKSINPMKEINDKISNGIKELFDSEKYKEYLQVMSKFHNYSVNNTVLIAMQMPTATDIAGFDAWKDNFSRNVIKGEKGIKIIAPTQVKIKQKIEKFDPKTDKPILGKDDLPITEEREFTTTEFRVTNVFDVSQTRFFKDPKAPEDQGAVKNKNYKNFISAVEKSAVKNPNDFLVAIEKASPVPINITEKMNEQQALETAINEIAHANLPKNANEIQIESVKYVLSQHYGLDTSNYSFENVSNWSEGRDVKELKSSLHTISKTASKLINDINQNIISLRKEKAQAQQNEAEPREYHEHINEKYVAAMKAREKEKAQEQAKGQARKKSKGKTYDVGED